MDIGKHFSKLSTPAFLVDEPQCRRNCEQMLQICESNGLTLRGQTKTHKTVKGGILQSGGSKRCIVVSTLPEAEMYAAAGFDDILYAFPLTPEKLERCAALAKKVAFHILIDNLWMLEQLEAFNAKAGASPWSLFLKIDCGGGRVGLLHDAEASLEAAVKVAKSSAVTLRGLYAHCGDSYSSASPEQTGTITADRLSAFVERLEARGVSVASVGIGSTPSATHLKLKAGRVNELHPGNYVFFDAQQASLGSCREDEIAVRVLSRIVGHYPHRNELLIDAGFAALTKQGLHQNHHPAAIFKGHPELALCGMTQELGKVTTKDGTTLNFAELPLGSTLEIFPWHSCATAALYPRYHVHNKEGVVVDEWVPCRGW